MEITIEGLAPLYTFKKGRYFVAEYETNMTLLVQVVFNKEIKI